jgi:hypothetical protein
MTVRSSFFPGKEGELNSWQKSLLRQCTEDTTTWGLDTAMMTQFKAQSDRADLLYRNNLDPSLKNKQTKAYKDEGFHTLKEFIRNTLYPALKANGKVKNADLVSMGFPSREYTAHEPAPVPDEAPIPTCLVGQLHDVTVYAGRPQHAHSTETQRKKGFYGYIIRFRVDGEAEWSEEMSTRLKYVLTFPAGHRGKNVTLMLAWINPRLQRGPWSAEVTVLIN